MDDSRIRYKNCFANILAPKPQIGALIRVSRIEPSTITNFKFPEKTGRHWVTVTKDDIMTFLGTETVKVFDYIHDKDEIEMRYFFLVNNEIIYTVDPGVGNKRRAFNWEEIPCETDIHTEPQNNL